MKIKKTLGLDVPKGREVISMIDNGKVILFDDGGILKLPKGQWKILTVENDIIHLLPFTKEQAIKEGYIY